MRIVLGWNFHKIFESIGVKKILIYEFFLLKMFLENELENRFWYGDFASKF